MTTLEKDLDFDAETNTVYEFNLLEPTGDDAPSPGVTIVGHAGARTLRVCVTFGVDQVTATVTAYTDGEPVEEAGEMRLGASTMFSVHA